MNRFIKLYILFLLLGILPFSSWATNFYTTSDGVFGTGANWSGGTSPGSNSISKYGGGNDTVFVRDAMTVATGFSVQGAQMVLVVEPGGSVTTGTGYLNAAHIIIESGGLLDYSGTFSTANSAVDRVTINGTMNIGGDINAAAGTWYIGPYGSLNVDGNILNNDPDMSFTNDGSVYVKNNVQFFTGTWTNGENSTFRTEGSDVFVGSANINNNGSMEFVNVENNTTWDGSWDCDGNSGTGSVDFGTNIDCSAICNGGGTSSCANNVPLPVDWLSIEANLKNDKVEVNWTTSSEKNNDFFIIEKSYDALQWFNIGTVNGAGNSSVIQNYNFTDQEINQGLVYYRIVQVDFDGQSQNSKTVYVDVDSDNETVANALFPNPNNGQFTLSISNEDFQSLEIYSLQKTLVPHRLDATNGTIEVSLLNAAKGYYTAVIITGKDIVYKNFLVK